MNEIERILAERDRQLRRFPIHKRKGNAMANLWIRTPRDEYEAQFDSMDEAQAEADRLLALMSEQERMYAEVEVTG